MKQIVTALILLSLSAVYAGEKTATQADIDYFNATLKIVDPGDLMGTYVEYLAFFKNGQKKLHLEKLRQVKTMITNQNKQLKLIKPSPACADFHKARVELKDKFIEILQKTEAIVDDEDFAESSNEYIKKEIVLWQKAYAEENALWKTIKHIQSAAQGDQ